METYHFILGCVLVLVCIVLITLAAGVILILEKDPEERSTKVFAVVLLLWFSFVSGFMSYQLFAGNVHPSAAWYADDLDPADYYRP